MSTHDLWIQAMQNVSRQVYDLQLAEYKRLVAASTMKSLATHEAEARAFITGKAVTSRRPRNPSQSGQWGAFTRNGWEYPQMIQIIRAVREEYGSGLKETKDLVETVINQLQ